MIAKLVRMTALVVPTICCVCLCMLPGRAHASDVFWKNAANGEWSDANNWSGGQVPGTGDDVFITTSGTYQVVLDQNAQINSLSIGATLGTQTLVFTSQTLTLTQQSLIGFSACLIVETGTINGGGHINNRGGLELRNATLNLGISNFADMFVENVAPGATELLGGFVNSTRAFLTVSNNENFLAVLHIEGGVNHGKIELTSESGADTELHYAGGLNKQFVNVTGATICSVTGAGGGRGLIAGLQTPFLNNGQIVALHALNIQNRAAFVNRGLLHASVANVTVANLNGAVFENAGGKLLVTAATVMRFENGVFKPGVGRVLGDGVYEFEDMRVRDGTFTVACTRARFSGNTEFEATAPIDNQGKMDVVGNATIFSKVQVFTSASINFNSDGGIPSQFNFNGNVQNDGRMTFSSNSASNSSFIDANFNSAKFANTGDVDFKAADGSFFASRNVNLKNGAEWVNDGNINVFTSASVNVTAEDSKFDSRNGLYKVQGQHSFSSIKAKADILFKAYAITLGNVQVDQSALLSVETVGQGDGIHYPITSATVTSAGLIFQENSVIQNANPDLYAGQGSVEFNNVKFQDPVKFDSGKITIANSEVITSANVEFAAPETELHGANTFHGDVTIAAGASVSFNSLGIGQGQDFSETTFTGKVTNKGTIETETPGTNASVTFDGAVFENEGMLKNTPTGNLNIKVKGSADVTFLLTSIVELLSNLGCSKIEVLDQAKLINQGGMRFKSNCGSTPNLLVANNAEVVNDGVINSVVPAGGTPSFIDQFFVAVEVKDNAQFLNGLNGIQNVQADPADVQLEFKPASPAAVVVKNDSKYTNEGVVNIKPELPQSAVPPAEAQPSSNISIQNAAEFVNKGQVNRVDVVPATTAAVSVPEYAPGSSVISVNDNAKLNNQGVINVRKQGTVAVISVSESACVTNSGLTNVKVQTLANEVICKQNGRFDNKGSLVFDVPAATTTALVRASNQLEKSSTACITLCDFGQFNNLDAASLAYLESATTALLQAKQNAIFNNCGTTKIDGVPAGASTATFDLSHNAEFNHKGTLDIRDANLNVKNAQQATFNFNGGSSNISLQNASFQQAGVTPVSFPQDFALNGNGTLQTGSGAVNPGNTSPGNSPGVLTVVGTYELTSTSTLDIEVGGALPGTGYDKLIVTGGLTLGGTLNLSLIDDFVPADGQEFVILEYVSVTGAFVGVNGAVQLGGINFDLVLNATNAVLQASTVDETIVDVDVYFQGYWNGTKHRRTAFMLELREGPDLATSAVVTRSSALHSTGATTSFEFDGLADGDYWLVVRHGGHIPLASATPVTLNSGLNTFDFSQAVNVTGSLLWLTDLPGNVKGALSGELNADNSISADDFVQLFTPNFGIVNPGQVPALD